MEYCDKERLKFLEMLKVGEERREEPSPPLAADLLDLEDPTCKLREEVERL